MAYTWWNGDYTNDSTMNTNVTFTLINTTGITMPFNPNKLTIDAYEAYAKKWLANRSPALPEPFAIPVRMFLSNLGKDARILEIGAGAGYTTDFIKAQGFPNVIPTDAAESFVNIMRNRLLLPGPVNLNILVANFTHHYYHGMWAGAVFHHMVTTQFRTALRNVRGGLKPGGILGLTVRKGTGVSFWDEKLPRRRFYQTYTQKTLRRQLEEAGFQPLAIDEFNDLNDEPWVFAIARSP